MERRVKTGPKWHNNNALLWFSLLVALLALLNATTADVTCRSCQSGHMWRAKGLLVRFDSSGEVLARMSAETPAQSVRCATAGECAPGASQKTRNTDRAPPEEFSGGAKEVAGLKVQGGEGEVEGSDGGAAAGGRRVRRSELRWSGEERRGAAVPRQDELKLNSSTFALSGDSSHNQAMVHWSGQNSSICKAMNLQVHEHNTFRRHSRSFLEPAIYHKWKQDQGLFSEELKQKDRIALGGDMRADSPGHSAKYGSYTMMDLDSEKVLDRAMKSVEASTWKRKD